MQQATVNLLADMGVQPGTLQAGLVSRDRVDRHHRPDLARSRPPATARSVRAASAVTITGTATDAGGGEVGGVEVSVDGGTTWHPADGRGSWSYTWTPGATGSGDDPEPRRRRQRQPRDARRRESTVDGRRSATCPCTIWTRQLTPADRSENDRAAGRARGQVPLRHRGLHHRPPLLQGRGQHRHPRRPPLDQRGSALADGHLHAARRPRAGRRRRSSTPVAITADTTYVASYSRAERALRLRRRLLRAAGSTARRCTRWPTASTARNGVYNYGASGLPDQHVPVGNYWVDVVFDDLRGPDTTAPTDRFGLSGRRRDRGHRGCERDRHLQRGDGPGDDQRRRPSSCATHSNATVPAAVTYDAATRTATLDPNGSLANSSDLHGDRQGRDRRGVEDAAGNALARRLTWSFTTAAPPPPPPDEGPGGPILVVGTRRIRSAATTPRSCAPRA